MAYINTHEAVRRLGVHPNTLRNWENNMHDLRIIIRKNKEVLQKLILASADQEIYYGRVYNRKYMWVDVPVIEEIEYENKPDPLTGGL